MFVLILKGEAARTRWRQHDRSSSAIRRTGLVQLGGWPSWLCVRFSSAIRRTGFVKHGGLPSWSRVRSSSANDWFSSADGQAGRMFDLARPSAELDWFSSADGRAGRVVNPARPSIELDVVLCPPFNKTSIMYATWCWLTSYWWHWKANLKMYLVSKYELNQTTGRSSSIAKHLTRLCSYSPQKVRPNELDCVFGSVIHFSQVFCSGTFVESVSRKL